MARVSLRIYNREIETLVERSQLDEAIAHCRHILQEFPKHLETYRLLGKSYLDARRYKEADDIFGRLLMAVPDDFVAHVGMSIINDLQNNLDAALWHMVRAFEVQPSNAAIQAELQRLYGRRDGVEPPKIRLTRGALAHMYVQGELYPQAISEINSVLDEDGGRHDMQTLLARAYFHAGQKNEAAELCSHLLQRYPYCLDANRILAELIPEPERGEGTQIYQDRVLELDPYAAHTTGSIFHTKEVSDTAVMVERLEWDGQSVEMQPDWDTTLGIGRDDIAFEGSEEPDWLKEAVTDAPSPDSSPSEETDSVSGEDPKIPAFMREAGWSESTGSVQEDPGEGTDADSEPALAEGDLPDWVKAMAPEGEELEADVPQAGEEDITQDDVPDWLQGIGSVQAAPGTEPSPAAEEIPDWLETMDPEEEVPASLEEQADSAPVLEDGQGEKGSEEPALQQPFPEAPDSTEPEPPSELQLESEQPLSEAIPEAAAEAKPDDLGTSESEQDDALAWLETLAAKHGADSEALLTEPDQRSESEPEWVQQAKASEASPADSLPDLQPDTEDEPVEPVAESDAIGGDLDFSFDEQAEPSGDSEVVFDKIDTGDLGTSSEEQDDALAWLEGLAAKQGAKSEELLTQPGERKESEPEWVQQAKEVGEAAQPAADSLESRTTAPDEPVSRDDTDTEQGEVASPPIEVEEEEQEGTGKPKELDQTSIWLRDLEKKGVPEQQDAPQESEPESADEAEIPDWLSDLEPESSSEAEAVPEPDAQPATDMGGQEKSLDWLNDLEAEPATQPEAVSEPDREPAAGEGEQEESLDWLSDLEAEASSQPESPAATDMGSAVGENEQEESLDWLGDLEAEASASTPAASDMEEDSGPDEEAPVEAKAPSGLNDLETEASSQPQADSAAETESSLAEETPVKSPDREAEIESESPTVEPVSHSFEVTDTGELPSWLAGLDSEEKPPAAESNENLPEWLRDEDEPDAVETEPTSPGDWQPAEASEPEELSAQAEQAQPEGTAETAPEAEGERTSSPPAQEPIQDQTLQRLEAVIADRSPAAQSDDSPREPASKDRSDGPGKLSKSKDPVLNQAQNELSQGNISVALEGYGKLIKKGRLLDEAIFDLREALYRYPVEVTIWQTLGDAYMRANRLQDALDAYTKAEELLR